MAIASREPLDLGDLVVKESPPSMGGLDIYRKGPGYAADPADLAKITFLNEMGMDALGAWIRGSAYHRASAAIALSQEMYRQDDPKAESPWRGHAPDQSCRCPRGPAPQSRPPTSA